MKTIEGKNSYVKAALTIGIVLGLLCSSLTIAQPTQLKINTTGEYNQSHYYQNSNNIIKNIAQWDGTSWQPLSYGRNVSVLALTTYGTDLIAAGVFDPQSQGSCPQVYINDSIVRWNGDHWSFLSWEYLRAQLSAVTVWNDYVIAGGGLFLEPPIHGLAQNYNWGSGWEEVGGGINSENLEYWVNSLTVYDERLVVGGSFDYVDDDISANGLALWDGVSWDTIGISLREVGPKKIYEVYAEGEDLYVGGAFSKMGEVSSKNFGLYGPYGPGGALGWSDQVIISDIDGDILSIVKYNDDIIVGGRFTQIDGISVNNIARWDGNEWQPMDGGMTGDNPDYNRISDLIVYNGDLIAGGFFTSAGGSSAINIARWDGSNWGEIAGTIFEQPHTTDPENGIWALKEYDNKLIVAGDFIQVEEDITPPVTTCIFDGEMVEDVYVSNVNVTLEATDDMSGVNCTMFKLDDGEWTEYTDSFIVSSEGEHTVSYYSVDNEENVETENSTIFTIQFPIEMDLTIEGGSVLIVTLDNVGRTPITDITWDVTIEGGFIIKPRFIPGTITEILPGDSYSLNNPIFGIGLGKLFPLPRITFTVDTPAIEPVEMSVDAQIFVTTVVVL